MGKRILSFVLAIIIVIGIMPTTVVDAATYSAYTGVNFSNANISAQRKAALTKAMQMVTVTWTCPADFPTWRSSGGVLNTVTATDGSSAQKFVAGKTYTGIPYSMCHAVGGVAYDDITWTKAISDGKITTSYMTGSYYGNGSTTGHGLDCSYFVYLALSAANAGSIWYQTTATMLNSSLYTKISWNDLKPADLFLKNGHVMMFVGMSGSNYAVFECDANDSKCSYNVYTKSQLSSYSCYRYNNFNDTVVNNVPFGVVDSVSVSTCKVILQGWVFDRDDINRNVAVHVYIGDKFVGSAIADGYRADVGAAYGVGNYHGFAVECTIPAEKTGNQTMLVYAIDSEATDHPRLFHNESEIVVNIPPDTKAPIISNVKIVSIDASGYTVSCTVTDNTGVNRVQFPTWTAPKQDDLPSDWGENPACSGTKNGNTYSFRVNISDHNYETTRYITHIYAYDNYGNVGSASVDGETNVSYKVNYHANGGTGAPSSQTKVHGKDLTLSSTVPKRTNYTFNGWSTSSTATTAQYQPGGRYTTNASVTLYAVWKHVCTSGHNYSYQVTTTPTTSATGKLTGICSRCSATTTVTMPMLNTTDYTYTVVSAPTCTATGTGRYTWKTTTYGNFYFDVSIAKTGHNYSYKVTTTPTTSATGKLTGTCSRCSATTTVTMPMLNTTDYTYTVVSAPTCTDAGTGRYTWKTTTYGNYSFAVSVPALGHDWSGLRCSRCGAVHMPFTDVPEGSYCYDPVIWAVEKGITNGTTPTTFSPNDPCTRWQIVTFLWRAAGCPEPTNTNHSFTDVSSSSVYYKAMLWAVENGITNGTTATTFSPNNVCTRWQIVTFLWRYAGCPEPTNTAHSFTDVSSGSVYYKAMLWAVENGITNGTTPTTFAPNAPCTRGQIVTFLYRYLAE